MQSTVTTQDFEKYLSLLGDGIEGLSSWEKGLFVPQGTSLAVFNANPFTVGHEYLANIASRRSAHVLVLVIQGRPESGGKGNHENTGIVFGFEDRIQMTKDCLKELSNVSVMPSGPYIISRDDYPEGFLKDRLKNVSAHALLDSMVICHFCNAVGIKTVYAGDEPRDEKSEIHLNALREQCRKSSIVLKVAERRRLGDKCISSAMVRDALYGKRDQELSLLVPEKALKFLTRHA